MKFKEIAKAMKMNPGLLSQLLKGHRLIGPCSARKIAAYLGIPDAWPQFYHMPGAELRRRLDEGPINVSAV
jgi:transcriptional regulator with XRE-family HTH domain